MSVAGGGGGGGGSGSYHLGLLFEAPANGKHSVSGVEDRRGNASSAFDFVCSSSGTASEAAAAAAVGERGGGAGEGGGSGRDEAVGFDRVCALRGPLVHIFTFFHHADGVAGRGAGEFSIGK